MKSKILRIYMPSAARVRGKLSFWKRVFGADLSWFLVKNAKESGIEQAMALRSSAGYLKGKKLVCDGVEVIPPDLPVCVELIDAEEKLRTYITQQQTQLEGCRVILFEGIELGKLP